MRNRRWKVICQALCSLSLPPLTFWLPHCFWHVRKSHGPSPWRQMVVTGTLEGWGSDMLSPCLAKVILYQPMPHALFVCLTIFLSVSLSLALYPKTIQSFHIFHKHNGAMYCVKTGARIINNRYPPDFTLSSKRKRSRSLIQPNIRTTKVHETKFSTKSLSCVNEDPLYEKHTVCK